MTATATVIQNVSSNATTDDIARLGLAFPRTGDFRDPAASGRRAALEVFNARMTTLKEDYEGDILRVLNGTAPEAFKSAFVTTLRTLCITFSA